MWNPVRQSIGMEWQILASKYLQEPISTKLRLEIIQRHERWWFWSSSSFQDSINSTNLFHLRSRDLSSPLPALVISRRPYSTYYKVGMKSPILLIQLYQHFFPVVLNEYCTPWFHRIFLYCCHVHVQSCICINQHWIGSGT